MSRLRELKEREIARDAEREQDGIRPDQKRDGKFSELKTSLDRLHNRIDDITSLRIPESDKKPAIIEARYEAPIPIHFDPKPVLEIIDRLKPAEKRAAGTGTEA